MTRPGFVSKEELWNGFFGQTMPERAAEALYELSKKLLSERESETKRADVLFEMLFRQRCSVGVTPPDLQERIREGIREEARRLLGE